MRRIKDIDSLYDFIGYVVLCAPDDFPKRDYLPPDRQMNLDRAFDELRLAIELVEADCPGADLQRGLSVALDRSLASYQQGNVVAGAHSLQEFQDLIFRK